MDDALGAEAGGVLLRIGYIVAMRQEDVPDAAALGEAACQVLHKTRRIHQPVALGMLHEVAVPAEGFSRIEAAVGDAIRRRQREIGHCLCDAAAIRRADGYSWARHQRTQRSPRFILYEVL